MCLAAVLRNNEQELSIYCVPKNVEASSKADDDRSHEYQAFVLKYKILFV